MSGVLPDQLGENGVVPGVVVDAFNFLNDLQFFTKLAIQAAFFLMDAKKGDDVIAQNCVVTPTLSKI